jgi:hypothetical protein
VYVINDIGVAYSFLEEGFMNRIKAMAVKPYILVFLVVCMAVALSAFRIGGLRAGTSKKQINFPVKSLVPKLTVVDVKVQHNLDFLSLRNDYDKTITAFSVSSSGVITRNEMLDSEEVIPPGITKVGEYEPP